MAKASPSNSLLRNLPSVDELLRSEAVDEITEQAGASHAATLARQAIAALRRSVVAGQHVGNSKDEFLAKAVSEMSGAWKTEQLSRVQEVVNCTGVVIHTNLGRAPLSGPARRALAEHAAGYCNLEYDLAHGRRGKRAPRCEELLVELTGAEAALVVNNCAAAAFFVLTVFAAGGEVVISRGELVEIGGDFRVPEVLAQSGATLREVGTTNRTSLRDYELAIGEQTRVILRVHPSNYRIIGFTAAPSLEQLSQLAQRTGLLLYEDLGSGALTDLSRFGLEGEPAVADSVAAGVDLVTFSGDKLLGGPQAGIIAGRRELIDRLRRHPLYRALRVDKLTFSALEATLDAYRRGDPAEIPVMAMISMDKQTISERARVIYRHLNAGAGKLNVELRSGTSAIGGGAAPAIALETELLALRHASMTAAMLEQTLRGAVPPVIARIENDTVLLDLRTVMPEQDETLLRILQTIS